jgi:hypothetical protein
MINTFELQLNILNADANKLRTLNFTLSTEPCYNEIANLVVWAAAHTAAIKNDPEHRRELLAMFYKALKPAIQHAKENNRVVDFVSHMNLAIGMIQWERNDESKLLCNQLTQILNTHFVLAGLSHKFRCPYPEMPNRPFYPEWQLIAPTMQVVFAPIA